MNKIIKNIGRLLLLTLVFGIVVPSCLATAIAEDERRPHEHLCPLTLQVMTDPVVVADGHSYERTAILEHFRINGAKSPKTNLPLKSRDLVDNHALKVMIREWKPEGQSGPLVFEALDVTRRIELMEVELERLRALESGFARAPEAAELESAPARAVEAAAPPVEWRRVIPPVVAEAAVPPIGGRYAEAVRGVERPIRGLIIPPVARGYEELYQRFLRGVLVYRPTEGSDVGRIDIPIAGLANPLDGSFDLSQCGNAREYLSIGTGYRKGKKAENAIKVEVWLTPRFLIERDLATTAGHFHEVMGMWDGAAAPVGIFWTWGGWENASQLDWYDYLTEESIDQLTAGNLYTKYKLAKQCRPQQYRGVDKHTIYANKHSNRPRVKPFMFIFPR